MLLEEAIILETPAPFEQWLVATISVSHDDAVKILSDPHYIETDEYRTAGGNEDHWLFLFPCGMKIGVILGVSYNSARIFADPPYSEIAIQYLQPLICDRDMWIADPPILIP